MAQSSVAAAILYADGLHASNMQQSLIVEATQRPQEDDSEWRLKFSPGWTVFALVFLGSALYLWSIHLEYLSVFDSLNFAYSLKRFNTFLHMPQPPGYPGFVLIARLFHKAIPTAISTFFAVGIVASLATSLLTAKLGEMLASARAGLAAAVLIMLHPATLSSIVVSPVRIFLGLVSAGVACVAWRMWTHPYEKWSLYAAWAALGVGSSFRPELAVFLFPLVFIASIRQRHSWRALVPAVLLFAACVFLWVKPTARPGGGIIVYFKFLRDHFAYQASLATAANGRGGTNAFWHMVLEASVWTFMGVAAWVWAVPAMIRRGWTLGRPRIVFFLLWFLPGYSFHCLFHIAAPGHALSTITTLCVLGGLALGSFRKNWLFVGGLIIASVINVLLYINPIMWSDGSPEWVKFTNGTINPPMRQLEAVTAEKDTFLIVNGGGAISWRVLRYYFADTPLLSLEAGMVPSCPQCATYFSAATAYAPSPIHGTIPVPDCGRIVWDINFAVPDSLKNEIDKTATGPLPIILAKPGLSFDLPGMHFESGLPGFCSQN